jgi:hypothetical protein
MFPFDASHGRRSPRARRPGFVPAGSRLLASPGDGQVVADLVLRLPTDRRMITTINDYATTIAAAVEQQTASRAAIARSVGQAADGSSSIAGTIAGVAEAAQHVTAGAASATPATLRSARSHSG